LTKLGLRELHPYIFGSGEWKFFWNHFPKVAENLGTRGLICVMHLSFFAFPFSLFSSLLHSRHYETDTFVLLEHTRNYKGYNYRTTSLLDIIFVPIPDIVIVLTHGNVIIHQPLDEP